MDMNQLGEDRRRRDPSILVSKSSGHVTVGINTQGAESEEADHPTQMTDRRFFVP